MPARPLRYRFAGYTLSPRRRSLRREGREVPLIPRYFDLLVLLVERREEALGRREIFERVWADVVVSDGALTQAIRTLRRTLGEDGEDRYIRTVSRHGYQFVCPVIEAEDAHLDEPLAPVPHGPHQEAAAAPPPDVAAMREAALARLLDPATDDDARRDAAEELHALGTDEALRALDRQPGHALAWAHLRDSRWNVVGAGPVPLLREPAGPAAWVALARLRLRQAIRVAGSRWALASIGGAVAGAAAGLLGGAAMAALGGSADTALLAALSTVAAVVAAAGAAGVGSGLAAAEVLFRSRRTLALAAFGAAGGGLVGLAAQSVASSLLAALFGIEPTLGGGLEGLVMGAAAGFGFGIATRRIVGGAPAPRGRSRATACASTALACALAGALLSAGGGRLGAASLDEVVSGFPATRVSLDRLGPLVGEAGLGPRTRAALGAAEGLLFGAGLALGLTHRPRRR